MAQLPKPLSEKSIQKMLSQWKPATVDKLHAYYAAFANFYGCLTLGEAWELYKRYDKGIKKKEFLEFSSIARREDLPYYILEIDEVYSDEKRSVEERIIAHKSLVGASYNQFFFLVNLENNIYERGVGFFLPEDILEYVDHDGIDDNEYWNEFSELINGLKTPSGVPLGESKELTSMEKTDLEYYKAEFRKKKILDEAEKYPMGTRLLNMYKRSFHMGWPHTKSVFMDMKANSIELSEFEKKRIEKLYVKIINTSNLWCNRGLSQSQLVKASAGRNGLELSVGPDVLKALQRTDLDIEEKAQVELIKEMLKEAGISIDGLDL